MESLCLQIYNLWIFYTKSGSYLKFDVKNLKDSVQRKVFDEINTIWIYIICRENSL